MPPWRGSCDSRNTVQKCVVTEKKKEWLTTRATCEVVGPAFFPTLVSAGHFFLYQSLVQGGAPGDVIPC